MSAGVLARTPHFALHRLALQREQRAAGAAASPAGPESHDSLALFGVAAQHELAWLGAMVPKRWAKRSVTRHALKRQIYAVAAENAAALCGASHVVRLRAGFDRREFVSASSTVLKQAARSELEQLFASALRRIARGQDSGARPAPGATAAKVGTGGNLGPGAGAC